jgi:DNA-binding NtrC family response regulator
MSSGETLTTIVGPRARREARDPVPALLIAFAPPEAVLTDRCILGEVFTLGRSTQCDLVLRDTRTSGRHLRLTKQNGAFYAEDLGSTNGTFLQGARLTTKTPLSNLCVLRVGEVVLVFHENATDLLAPPPSETSGIVGRFHHGALLGQLQDAARSARHVLITGPSGSGKELAARALANYVSRSGSSPIIVAHNAAKFATADEAASTLFGVSSRVFSGVDARPGLIEQAHGGVLFLDESHSLPERLQRSLLRVIEDGKTCRIGETKDRAASVRFVLASNVPGPDHGLCHDLLARLRLIDLLSLASRNADIPTIFESLLRSAASAQGVDAQSAVESLCADYYEMMCLDGFHKDNVRGLVDLADRITTAMSGSKAAITAAADVMHERFGKSPVWSREILQTSNQADSHYERYQDVITKIYKELGGNLSEVERQLRLKGLTCSRRWLRHYAKKWGLRDS